ncbi:LOW QUALITY PROTEIN: MYCBP-associated protein [Leucoraja erinacea]|uniref:LOW QUALITY PROTEIN: MYCBP-associated protein n=1 Tax=Leucoraja erinaceus TaxID=7782 RepID=UPI002457D6DF|nr:LOW QUALITY PROTEIN: MYCBP-associated protein [Leucoraja erinacea]
MGTRAGSKASRRDGGMRTPPVEKKKEKKEIEEIVPIVEEPEKDDVLKGEDIMALAIKPEDLTKLHLPRTPLKTIPATSRIVVRKPKPMENVIVKKIIAKPAPLMDELKTMDYSGPGGPRFDAEGRVLPHSVLGSLVDFKRELLARGLTEMASVISDRLPSEPKPQELPVYEKKPEDNIYANLHDQDNALANWQWHMAERKRTQKILSMLLDQPVEDLVMNQCEDLGQMRQQSTLIDQTIAALGPGKGYSIGSEFWSIPPWIGDELSGVRATLNQTERGFAPPIVRIGKSRTMKQETGTDFSEKYRKSIPENLHLKRRLEEMKTVLRHLDFREPTEATLAMSDLLENYPDVINEPIIGPSIMFCGHPARWIKDSCSHKDEVGMIVRLTFEAMVGDKAMSCLELINDGTTVIHYKWKRVPEPKHCVKSPSTAWMQRFYFSTNSGVILPGETINFPFTFKSPNAGVFTDIWEFCTHPVLLAGASLQVALWGVALFADRNEETRQQLQVELEMKEKMAIVERILNKVVAGVQTPQRSQSPPWAPLAEEDIFKKNNPKLHYKYDTVQSLKELWKECFVPSKDEGEAEIGKPLVDVNIAMVIQTSLTSIHSPNKSSLDLELDENDKPPDDALPATVQPVEPEPQWDLSVSSFRQDVLTLLEDEQQKERALEHLNLKMLELYTTSITIQENINYKIVYQLWVEALDGLVSYSMRQRDILGLPEKETETLEHVEETLEQADLRKQTKKDDKKGADKKGKRTAKSAGKEDEKEKRQSGKKTKTKDDKKSTSPISSRSSKHTVDSKENLLQDPTQMDPVIVRIYREKLYTEVYGMLSSMMTDVSSLLEELMWKHRGPLDKCI